MELNHESSDGHHGLDRRSVGAAHTFRDNCQMKLMNVPTLADDRRQETRYRYNAQWPSELGGREERKR
jgi:hypothetical protein